MSVNIQVVVLTALHLIHICALSQKTDNVVLNITELYHTCVTTTQQVLVKGLENCDVKHVLLFEGTSTVNK